MKILAIESSCDDTAIGILEKEKTEMLAHSSTSQEELHKEWGGVYPTVAKREHQKNLIPALEKTLKEAELLKKGNSHDPEIKEVLSRETELKKATIDFLQSYGKPDIDFLAVTVGPGLDPCLWAGINLAKALSFCWNLEVVPINHVRAHFFAPLLLNNPPLPAVSLVASGGHTQLILSSSLNNHEILGATRDDAAGECFDKTARVMGLEYPGGPEISELAKKKTEKEVELPRPMIESESYDFSFAGLKTAVLYGWKDKSDPGEDCRIAMAKEIEESITDVLTEKTFRAAEDKKAKTVILGGGVSANEKLRKKFKTTAEEKGLELILPEKRLSTDNAEMIAIDASHRTKKRATDRKNLEAEPNLKIN